jgi:hypothetical protein
MVLDLVKELLRVIFGESVQGLDSQPEAEGIIELTVHSTLCTLWLAWLRGI